MSSTLYTCCDILACCFQVVNIMCAGEESSFMVGGTGSCEHGTVYGVNPFHIIIVQGRNLALLSNHQGKGTTSDDDKTMR